MSFRTALLPVLQTVRAVTGPTGLDLRTNQLTIRSRYWAGGLPHEGSSTDLDRVLPAVFPIRFITEQEVNERGGQYEVGDVLVDSITPSDGNGAGYTVEELNPKIHANNVEVIYVITGSHAGEYSLVDIRTFRPFTWQMVLRRRMTSP